MEISDLSRSVTTATSLQAVADRLTPARADNEPQFVDDDKGRALDAFRNEIRTTLRARFFSQFGGSAPGYSDNADARTIAGETLGAAQRIAAEAPTRAASSLVTVRAAVRETANAVRDSLGARDDIGEINDAVALIDDGLAGLASAYGNVRESSASVVSVDASVRERSTIRIRTQEGDVVRLDLRSQASLSASDEVSAGGRESALEFSASSRVRLSVDGDLNDNELAAIRGVVEQADAIADEFFGGDLGAAFNGASGLEFDGEQLDRVNLRFRYAAETNVSVATQTPVVAAPAVAAPVVAPVAPRPTLTIPALTVVRPEAPPNLVEAPVREARGAPSVVPTPTSSDEEPLSPAAASAEPSVVATPDVAATPEEEAGPPLGSEYLDQFFNLLSDFLRSVSDGFGAGDDSSAQYQYSESFKLTLLRETLTVAAAPQEQNAAELAASAVDRVLDVAGVADEEPVAES